ncbi:MAG: hypothetical protein MUP82_06395 [Candidatus Marinimicrobia bacterium]|nr:hypothetical protein [Candidatus Neomarinimicrobiota bacterium]
MAKHNKRTFKRHRQIRRRKNTRKMRGGNNFSSEQKVNLRDSGFSDEDITFLESTNSTNMERIQQALTMKNDNSGQLISPKDLIDMMQEELLTKQQDMSGKIPPMEPNGGKRQTARRYMGQTSRRHRRKQRGGTCYGSGVGANSFNPNFSIYNTNALKLFPYRPE